jgi:DNA repair photolyase
VNINEIHSKAILVKSKLPATEYVVNPYVGCAHKCRYCYARFMKRFTGHPEPWGEFVDAKINALHLLQKQVHHYEGGEILFGSVTDPYQPIECTYELTRSLLIELRKIKAPVVILTKSDLVVRDIDIFEGWDNCMVAISGTVRDENVRKLLEPGAPPLEKRLSALKKLKAAGVPTVLFISSIMPFLTDWKALVEATTDVVTEYWFENLNFYPSIRKDVFNAIQEIDTALVEKYEEIYLRGSSYWIDMEQDIKQYCSRRGLEAKTYFHHKEMVS